MEIFSHQDPQHCFNGTLSCDKKMNIILILSQLFLIPSYAMTPDEIRAEIHAQISQRHPELATEFWSSLGPDALPVLKQMYSETNSPAEKAWLLEGLAHFSDPSVGSLLQGAITQSENAVLKKKMLSALVQSQGDAALDFVEPFLEDKDPHIRLAVAKAMRNYMTSSRIEVRLGKFQRDEKEEWVKKDFETKDAPVVMKRAGSIFQQKDSVKAEVQAPLEEKDWAGEWKGIYVTANHSSAAVALLTLQNKKWKVALKLPKMAKLEMNSAEIEVSYFQSTHRHWIQIKNKKEDSVFLAQKEFNRKR